MSEAQKIDDLTAMMAALGVRARRAARQLTPRQRLKKMLPCKTPPMNCAPMQQIFWPPMAKI